MQMLNYPILLRHFVRRVACTHLTRYLRRKLMVNSRFKGDMRVRFTSASRHAWVATGCWFLACGALAEEGMMTMQANGDRRAPDSQACVAGVDEYRVCEPMFEAVRIVLAHRGAAYSPEYIQGISGAAFRIAGICPCAPTCSKAMEPIDLVRLLGYECRLVSPMDEAKPNGDTDSEFAKLMRDDWLPPPETLDKDDYRRIRAAAVGMIDAIKDEIRAGRPVVVWHAFTSAENDVVTGFDDVKEEFLGRGSYVGNRGEYGHARQHRCIRSQLVGGWPSALIVGERARPFDARAAEMAALREAVRHARDASVADRGPRYQGLRAYDEWIREFQSPDKKRGNGDAYCYGVYRSTHRAAAGFLREIAPRYPAAKQHLEDAAKMFEAEAATLDKGEGLLWWRSPEGPDTQRNVSAAELLGEARKHYAAGIAAIERALVARTVEESGATMTNETAGTAVDVVYDRRVVVTNAPRPFASCSTLASLAAALQQRGEDITYTYLVGASAFAFRLQFSWCPGAPHAQVGYDCVTPALAAVGYAATRHPGTLVFSSDPAERARPATPAELAATRAAVKAAIDANETVIYGSEEDGLLVGYEPVSKHNASGWLCRPGPLGPPPKPGEPYALPIKHVPWGGWNAAQDRSATTAGQRGAGGLACGCGQRPTRNGRGQRPEDRLRGLGQVDRRTGAGGFPGRGDRTETPTG